MQGKDTVNWMNDLIKKQYNLQQLVGPSREVRQLLDIQIPRESKNEPYVKDGTKKEDIETLVLNSMQAKDTVNWMNDLMNDFNKDIKKQYNLQQLVGPSREVRQLLDIQIPRESKDKPYLKDGTTRDDITQEDCNYSEIRNRITNEEYNNATDVKEHQCAASVAVQQIRKKLYDEASKNDGLFIRDGRVKGAIYCDEEADDKAYRKEWKETCEKDDDPVVSKTHFINCDKSVVNEYIGENQDMNQDITENLHNLMKPASSRPITSVSTETAPQTSFWDSLPDINSVCNVLSKIGASVKDSFSSLNLNCFNSTTSNIMGNEIITNPYKPESNLHKLLNPKPKNPSKIF